ncbi:hypothetical protein D3C78_1278130 [compost metagenome]
MKNLLTDKNTMLIFRTYWPVITILIGLLVFYIKQRRERSNLKILLGWEFLSNVTHIYVCTPESWLTADGKQDTDTILDSVRALSNSTKYFSTVVYEKNISSMGVLSKKEKQIVFSAYNTLTILSALGKEISELLKKDSRSKSESERLIKNSYSFYQATKNSALTIEKALAVFGYGKDDIQPLKNSRGSGIENMRINENLLK